MNISVAEAHNRLSYWLNRLAEGPITITRRGKPVGVIIAPEDYERLQQFQAYQQVIQLAQTLHDSGVTADELYKASREELEEQR